MIAIKDEIRIAAPAGKVYEALTRQGGYRAWWNAAGEVAEAVGGEANLHFVKEGKPVDMRFRIDEMKVNESVRWTCVANDGPSWVGTTLSWRIKDAGGLCPGLLRTRWVEGGPAGNDRAELEALPG